MQTSTTTLPCKCCEEQEEPRVDGYVCRSFAGTAALVGFAEYGIPSDPPRFYRRGSSTGSVSTTLDDVDYGVSAGSATEFDICDTGQPSTAGTVAISTYGNAYVGATYHFQYDPSENYTDSSFTIIAPAFENVIGVGNVTKTTARMQFFVVDVFPPYLEELGPTDYLLQLSKETTFDYALRNAVCQGYDPPTTGTSCKTYLTSIDTDPDSASFRELTGQSLSVIFTLANSRVGQNTRIEIDFQIWEYEGAYQSSGTVTLDFVAPDSAYPIRYDFPLPNQGYEIRLIDATISQAGSGGSVTLDDTENAFTIDE